MRMFRTLRANEIECRISEIGREGKYIKLLLYKTARTDAALLDETVGPFAWQSDYRTIDGKMYCGIGIKEPISKEWVWKWNVGTESNTEAEKGQASDALKRAGFVWGIGTELYSAPEITIFSGKFKVSESNGKYRCYDKFEVTEIAYDANEDICHLEIKNATSGALVFTWDKSIAKKATQEAPAPVKETKKSEPDFYNETTTAQLDNLPITEAQLDSLRKKLTEDEQFAICTKYRTESLGELTFAQADKTLRDLKKRGR